MGGFFASRVGGGGGLVFGGAYFRACFTVYYISLLSFAHRITYIELEITFFDCLKTLQFELIFAFTVTRSKSYSG